MVFEELDAFENFITPPAQSRQFTNKDDVNMVVETKFKRFLEEGSILVRLSARNVLFICLDDLNVVGVRKCFGVFYLPLRTLTILKSALAAAPGKNYS